MSRRFGWKQDCETKITANGVEATTLCARAEITSGREVKEMCFESLESNAGENELASSVNVEPTSRYAHDEITKGGVTWR